MPLSTKEFERHRLKKSKRPSIWQAKVGSNVVTLHPPRCSLFVDKETKRRSYTKLWQKIVNYADLQNVHVSVELMEKIPKEFVTTPEEMDDFIRDVKDSVSLTLDLAHCQSTEEFMAYRNKLSPISKFHITNKIGKKLHTPISEPGDLDIVQVLHQLRHDDVPVVVEGFAIGRNFEACAKRNRISKGMGERTMKKLGVLAMAGMMALATGCQAQTSTLTEDTTSLSGSLTVYTSQPEEDIQSFS